LAVKRRQASQQMTYNNYSRTYNKLSENMCIILYPVSKVLRYYYHVFR